MSILNLYALAKKIEPKKYRVFYEKVRLGFMGANVLHKKDVDKIISTLEIEFERAICFLNQLKERAKK